MAFPITRRLLELLVSSFREWPAHLAAELPSAVRRRAAFKRRAEQLATAIAGSLVERPVLCDLMSTQAAVLEHNVSVGEVTRYKLAVLADAEILAGLVRCRAAQTQPGARLALHGWRLG